jgi:glycosyltransferase involved in cell wall biosynthesis
MTDEVTGLIVNSDDHEALAREALRLLDDNNFALQLAHNAHQASKKFTWPYIRDEWLDLYRKLSEKNDVSFSRTSESQLPLAKTDSAV